MHPGILDIISRSVLSILVLFLLARLMGKKQISQLSFFDYVTGITIGSIAANLSVDETITYAHGIVAMGIWAACTVAISFLNLKSMRLRRVVEGVPTVLIRNGKIIRDNLAKEKFHVNDLLEELRIKGIFDIADVEFAVLETGGQVSVQLKSQRQPVTPADLHLPTRYEGLTANLIVDGKVLRENLYLVNLDEDWLIRELHGKGIKGVEDVLLAALATNGRLYVALNDAGEPRSLTILE